MTLLLYLQPLIPPTDAPHYLLICKLPKDFSCSSWFWYGFENQWISNFTCGFVSIVSIVWFSGSHCVTDSTIWSSYLVTKFDSSRVTIDGESRSQCVRTSRTESGLAPAAPCRWHALLPCPSRPLIPISVSARRTDSLNVTLQGDVCRTQGHRDSKVRTRSTDLHGGGSFPARPWGWMNELIHSLLCVKSDWMHLRTHRFYLFYCDSGQKSPTYPLLHRVNYHWLNRSPSCCYLMRTPKSR